LSDDVGIKKNAIGTDHACYRAGTETARWLQFFYVIFFCCVHRWINHKTKLPLFSQIVRQK
jgi:hypothetical protein